MKKGSKLELVSHTGHNQSFLKLCENVEVAVGGLKTCYHIFVVKNKDYNLVFGQLFSILLSSVKTINWTQFLVPSLIF